MVQVNDFFSVDISKSVYCWVVQIVFINLRHLPPPYTWVLRKMQASMRTLKEKIEVGPQQSTFNPGSHTDTRFV